MPTIDNFFTYFCDRCVHAHLDPARGVICGLTDQRPDRTRECPDLVIDAEREEDVELREHLKSRVQAYRSMNEEGASMNPYPDPQGQPLQGWRLAGVWLLKVMMVLLIGFFVWLKWWAGD